ncbi:MAG: hypothetical protein MUF40_03085 [Gemmatimonadaceae bacterium]|nr:hypothetical protein [Gemmatimonadaceae bacterium]
MALLSLLLVVLLVVVVPRRGTVGPRMAAVARRSLSCGAWGAGCGLVIGIAGPRFLLPGSDDAALAGMVAVPAAALLGAIYGALVSLARGDRNDA